MEFKSTKTGAPRTLVLAGDAMATLDEHRIQQDGLDAQCELVFGTITSEE